ncbi:Metallo-dependent phosphatase-like protein [Dipodascopsis tothii]|uniref:Metallo-dependent phosphatase-like protein n=1 Tax=Dipodascopsis tothii TaxID=44089 RepID=UPI0034CD8954
MPAHPWCHFVLRRLLRFRLFVFVICSVVFLLLIGNNISVPKSPLGSVHSAAASGIHGEEAHDGKPHDGDLKELYVQDIMVKGCWRLFPCRQAMYTKIQKDLLLSNSLLKRYYVFVKYVELNTFGDEQAVVLDVSIGDTHIDNGYLEEQQGSKPHENSADSDSSYERVPDQQRILEDYRTAQGTWTYRGQNLWLKLGRPTDLPVTGVDVLYGKHAKEPRNGWSLRGDERRSLTVGNHHPRLTIRLGSPDNQTPLPPSRLEFDRLRKYKILQVADLHLSTGPGQCLDVFPPESVPEGTTCEADLRTLDFLNRILDDEKPNLAVLTGDQIFGDAAPDAQTALFKAVYPFVARKIPFAVMFGNHDDEGDLSRTELMNLLTSSSMPYSLSQHGPENVRGTGNYALSVYDTGNEVPVMTLFFLDTHKYSPNPKKMPGYDWIHESQLEYLSSTFKQLSPIRKQIRLSGSKLTHLSMAFFHIPLTEYRNTTNHFIGSYREPSTAPYYNTGARSLLSELGISVASVGHDHVNDFCMRDENYIPTAEGEHSETFFSSDVLQGPGDGSIVKNKNIWLCHGGGVGLGGYAGYGGYVRRLRLFEIDAPEGRISTWKRLEYGDVQSRIDEQILVERGIVM